MTSKMLPMRISFCCTGTKAAPWVEGLAAALPGAQVSEWQPGAPQADYGVVWSPPQQFMDEQTALKGIFNIGAGVDALMKLKLPPKAMVVRIDDGGMAVQMAEFVCHALIRHFRELDVYDKEVAQRKWSYRKPRRRDEFPVGIMGLGVLGQRVAEAMRHFEFPVLGWSRTAKDIPGVRCFSGDEQLNAFLAATKVLVCLLPLTAQTQGIMNRANLSRLLPGGYVINVARGAHLVDEDLIALLDSGHVAGATLDVFRTEPLPAGHPFWSHPRILLTPHIASMTTPEAAVEFVLETIGRHRRGETLPGRVDRDRGY